MFRALPPFRALARPELARFALAPALLLAVPALLAPLSASPALTGGAPGNGPVVLAQEAPPPPPAARKHDCERQEEGVS